MSDRVQWRLRKNAVKQFVSSRTEELLAEGMDPDEIVDRIKWELRQKYGAVPLWLIQLAVLVIVKIIEKWLDKDEE